MRINFRKRSFFKTILALVRIKFIAPIIRSKKPPEITARGSMVGMIWAMTPLVGIQMYCTFLTWLFTRKCFKWDFNLPVALAWNWVTNVFTAPPFYYLFYLTGKLMTGRFDERASYLDFYREIKNIFSQNELQDALKLLFDLLVKDWGVAMMIGCVPWIIVGGWLGYKWTFLFLQRRIKNREKRLSNKQKRLEKKLENTQKKLEGKIEKLEEKLEVKREKLEVKLEVKREKLEEKIEKTIEAREEALIETQQEETQE